MKPTCVGRNEADTADCGEPASMLVKPHAAPYEFPLCTPHGEALVSKLTQDKEAYTLQHVTEQPTPEEELRATIGRLEHEKSVQHKELVELRSQLVKRGAK